MALAILKFLSVEDGLARFSIDTGTNPYYTIMIGRGSYSDHLFQLLDGVVSETGMRKNDKSSNLMDSSLVVTIPAERFSGTNCFVQLQTFKDDAGRSPAYSRIVKMRAPVRISNDAPDAFSFSYSQNRFAMYQESLNAQRNIPFAERTAVPGDNGKKGRLLRQLVESASPMVLGMLNGQQQSNSKHGSRLCTAIGLLNIILNLFAKGSDTQKTPSQTNTATASSGIYRRRHRFATSRSKSDPVTGLAAPSAPEMPESPEDLMIKKIIEQIQKEALLGAFLDNQGTDGGIDMNKLMQFLQQPPATGLPVKAPPVSTAPQPSPVAGAKPTPSASTTGTANGVPSVSPDGSGDMKKTSPVSGDLLSTPQSLSRRQYSFIMSEQSLLTFEAGPMFMVNDKTMSVYKKTDLKFKVRLAVLSDGLAAGIPKAIVSFTFKGADNETVLEKVFRKTDVKPGELMLLDFTEFELKPLPAGRHITITAEIRWPDPASTAIVKAFGTTTVVFAEGYLPKTTGNLLPGEKELASMEQYRPFWNKVWESPVGGSKNQDPAGAEKRLWKLDVDLLYRIKCCGGKESNGLMHSRLALNDQETEGVTDVVEGKLKSGIELSISELNKLAVLWGNKPLGNGQLAAARCSEALTSKSFESVYHVMLKGKMQQRGMVWIVPVLVLQEIILSEVSKADENGQVTEMMDVTVQVPVPYCIRIITLKSN